MALTIPQILRQFKTDVSTALSAEMVRNVCIRSAIPVPGGTPAVPTIAARRTRRANCDSTAFAGWGNGKRWLTRMTPDG